MRVAIVSDIHLRPRDLDIRLPILEKALQEAKDIGACWIFNGGDTFDSATISSDPRIRAGELLGRFFGVVERIGLPWLILAGNPGHDGEALRAIASHPLLHVVWKPCLVSLGTLEVACLPWLDLGVWLAEQTDEVRALPPETQKELFRQYGQEVLKKLAGQWSERGYRLFLGHLECQGAVNSYDHVIPGSSLVFSTDELTAVGAHLTLSGHVHRRQTLNDGNGGFVQYIGAFTQLRHDETGNPMGWIFLDASTGTWEWREVEAPRYYTVAAEEYSPDAYQSWDRVKVRGKVPPPVLGKNAVFEAAPEEVVRVSRVQQLDPDQDPAALLELWLRSAKPEALDQLDLFKELLAHLKIPDCKPSCWGSLDRIVRIRLEGIGPHKLCDLRFSPGSGQPDHWVLVGPTGSGKTLAVESVLAAFFGSLVYGKRGGTSELFAMATAEDARIEVEFEAGGARYRVHRKIHRRGERVSQQAFVERWASDGWKHLAGPSPGAVESFIEELVGPRRFLLGSVFLSQEAAEDLVSATDAPRMAFLREIVGRPDLDQLAEQAKQRAGDVRDRLLLARRQAEESIQWIEKIRVAQQMLEQLCAEKDSLESQQARCATEKQQLREQLQCVEARLHEHQLATTRLENFRQARKAVQERIQRFRQRLEELQAILHDTTTAQELGQLLEQKKVVEETRQRLVGLVAEKEKIGAQLRVLAADRQSRLREAQAQLEDTKRSAQTLQGVGCAPALLQKIQPGLERHGPLPCPLIDHHRAKVARLSELEALCQSLGSMTPEETRLQQAYNEHESQIQNIQHELAVLDQAGIERRLEELRRKEGARQAAHDEVRVITEQLAQDQHQEKSLESQIQELEQSIPDITEARLVYEQTSEALRKKELEGEGLQRSLVVLGERLGAVRRDLEVAQENRKKAEAARKSVEQLQRELEGWSLLEEAFGRTGIPQLLIDCMLPALEEFLTEICQEDYQGLFRVRLGTQRVSRKGAVSEGLPILFCRRGLEYDVSRCSEGEKEAVRMALRAALGLFQLQRSHGGYRVMVLDEPMTGQSEEWREGTMRLLHRMTRHVQQVIVVTHMPSLAAAFPNQLTLGGGEAA
jgi:DNA repair exonuclease SbcCD ATPase subunit/DNA repair exonuclease SbcCD nuclease subunit